MKRESMKNLFCTLLVSVFVFSGATASAATELSGTAPDFTLPSNQGQNMRLEELRGSVVLINFWASWCGPCRQEMPALEALYQRYNKAGFTILGVSVDDDSAEANKLLKEIPVSFPVLYDTESKVSELYSVQAMPSTIIVDRNGEMRYLHRGYKPGYEDEYRDQIRALIRE